jgi:hypothetical protein
MSRRSASVIVRKKIQGIAALSALTPPTLPVRIVWMNVASV